MIDLEIRRTTVKTRCECHVNTINILICPIMDAWDNLKLEKCHNVNGFIKEEYLIDLLIN